MLLAEVKEELKKYKKEDLTLIICELYKAAPKKMREEKDLDDIIKDIHAYKAIGKVGKEQPQRAFEELKPEIERFIDYAYNQYYFLMVKGITGSESMNEPYPWA